MNGDNSAVSKELEALTQTCAELEASKLVNPELQSKLKSAQDSISRLNGML